MCFIEKKSQGKLHNYVRNEKLHYFHYNSSNMDIPRIMPLQSLTFSEHIYWQDSFGGKAVSKS